VRTAPAAHTETMIEPEEVEEPRRKA
jgi:hypothetical protein